MAISDRKFTKMTSAEESARYQSSTDITQEIADTSSAVAVTLANPHAVENATDTAANIAIKYRNDTAYRIQHFTAGQVKPGDVISIGGTADGTTVTKVLIRGVK